MAEEGDGDDDLDIEFSVDYDLISAGDSISINSPGGSYATLFRDTDDEANLYSVESGATIAAPVPDTLSAIISGDVFPAFAIVAIPDVLDLEFSSPADGEIVTAVPQYRSTAVPQQLYFDGIKAV